MKMIDQITQTQYEILKFLEHHNPIMGYVDWAEAEILRLQDFVTVNESQIQPVTGNVGCGITHKGIVALVSYIPLVEEEIIVIEEDNPVPPPPELPKIHAPNMFDMFVGAELAPRPDF